MPENKDITLVDRVHFNPTDVSVAAQIERVKAAKPQAFIAWSTGAPIATVFKGIVQAGLDCAGRHDRRQHDLCPNEAVRRLPAEGALFARRPLGAHSSGVKLPAVVKKAQKEFYAAFKADKIGT